MNTPLGRVLFMKNQRHLAVSILFRAVSSTLWFATVANSPAASTVTVAQPDILTTLPNVELTFPVSRLTSNDVAGVANGTNARLVLLSLSRTTDRGSSVSFVADGAGVWTNRFDGRGSPSDLPSALAVDGNGNVFVSGYSGNPFSDQDYITIRYLPERHSGMGQSL
jgi:hypothetical protein